MPVAEVQHPVERAEQRIELVRAEQHGDPQLPLQLAHELHHALLMRRVETDERLVEEQQARLAEQRLREQQSLALPARELGERAPGQRARADAIERRGDVAPRGSARDRHAEPMSVDGARDEIPSAQPALAQCGFGPGADSRSPGCRARPAGRARGSCRSRGVTSPRMARMRVVLPAPFGPSTPTNSASRTARSTSCRSRRPPTASVTPLNSTALKGARPTGRARASRARRAAIADSACREAWSRSWRPAESPIRGRSPAAARRPR